VGSCIQWWTAQSLTKRDGNPVVVVLQDLIKRTELLIYRVSATGQLDSSVGKQIFCGRWENRAVLWENRCARAWKTVEPITKQNALAHLLFSHRTVLFSHARRLYTTPNSAPVSVSWNLKVCNPTMIFHIYISMINTLQTFPWRRLLVRTRSI